MDKGNIARGGVVVGGLSLLVLLFFADKTQLKSNKSAMQEAKPTEMQTNKEVKLPPLAPDDATQKWIDAAEKAQGKELSLALDSVIARLSARNRFDYALEYAEKKLKLESSLQNQQLAGEIALKATRLDELAKDSVLFRSFSDKSIQYLEAALQKDSLNETTLLNLGMAYVESKQQQNSMKGILTIRKVTEINPKNVVAQMQLGFRSLQTGQFEKAESRFTNALAIDPKNEWARYYLAFAKKQLGKLDEAKKLVNGLDKETKDVELKTKLNELFTP